MLKKLLGKAVAGTAAAGLVFVPAIAVPATATAAPQDSNRVCSYPDPAATSTDLRLRFTSAPYGSRNVANVRVRSAAGTPTGPVRVRVAGTGGTKWLRDGSTSIALTRGLRAGRTYTVGAYYLGTCKWRASSDVARYTVTKAAVRLRPAVIDARSARFRATVSTWTGVTPNSGTARFVVKRLNSTRTVAAGTARVHWGKAAVNLRNLDTGRYRLQVTYAGDVNFKQATATRYFSVRRR